MIASLAVGLERFLQFAESVGAIGRGQRLTAWEHGWSALIELSKDQDWHFDGTARRRG